MSKCEVDQIFRQAFRLWSEHADVEFKQVYEGEFEFLIKFVTESKHIFVLRFKCYFKLVI